VSTIVFLFLSYAFFKKTASRMSIYYSYKRKEVKPIHTIHQPRKGKHHPRHTYGETPNSSFFLKKGVSSMLAANACASDH